jgi:hypothetical protein
MHRTQFLEHVGAAVDRGDPVGGDLGQPHPALLEHGSDIDGHPASLTRARPSTPSLSPDSHVATRAFGSP